MQGVWQMGDVLQQQLAEGGGGGGEGGVNNIEATVTCHVELIKEALTSF